MTDAATEHLEVTRTIRAGRQRVFDAWTSPDMIVQWWGAGGITCPEAQFDLTVGGIYRIANQSPDGAVMWITGTFSHIDPPISLTYTWAMEPVDLEAEPSIVEVTFDEVDDGTLVTVRQTRISSAEERTMHLAGWNGCLDGLRELLAG